MDEEARCRHSLRCQLRKFSPCLRRPRKNRTPAGRTTRQDLTAKPRPTNGVLPKGVSAGDSKKRAKNADQGLNCRIGTELLLRAIRFSRGTAQRALTACKRRLFSTLNSHAKNRKRSGRSGRGLGRGRSSGTQGPCERTTRQDLTAKPRSTNGRLRRRQQKESSEQEAQRTFGAGA